MNLLDSLKRASTELVENTLVEQSLYEVFSQEEADRIRAERLALCEHCSYRVKGLCSVCLCIIEIKTKTFTHKTVTGVVRTNCDKNRWPELKIQ